jgi:hypothetical protein
VNRDRRTLVCVGIAVAALFTLLAIVTLVWAENSGEDGAPAPVELAQGGSRDVHAGVVVLEVTLLAVFLGFGAFAIWRIVRQRAPKFDDLDPEEQRRREEAGRMLHDLGDPPVRRMG